MRVRVHQEIIPFFFKHALGGSSSRARITELFVMMLVASVNQLFPSKERVTLIERI
jgi:hypothetical protein